MTDYNNEYDNDCLEDLEIDPSEILDYSISEKISGLCGEEKAAFWRSFYQQARQLHRLFITSVDLRENFDVDVIYNRRNQDAVYQAIPAGCGKEGPCLLLQGVIDDYTFSEDDTLESRQSLFIPENESAFVYELNTDDGLIDLFALTYQQSSHALDALGFNLKHRRQIHHAGELDY